MLVNLNHSLYTHIRQLINNLAFKKMLKNIKNELNQLMNSAGIMAEKYILLCLFESIDFNSSKDQLKLQFLNQQLTYCSSHIQFLDYFSQIIESLHLTQKITEFINEIGKNLKLTYQLQITMCISLVLSFNQEISKEGLMLLRSKLNEYFAMKKPLILPEYALAKLLYILKAYKEFEDLSTNHKNLIDISSISDKKNFEFKPLLTRASSSSSALLYAIDVGQVKNLSSIISLPNVLEDLGYASTHSVAYLIQILRDFPVIDEDTIAQTLVMMVNELQKVEDSTNKLANLTIQSYKKNGEWDKLLNDNIEQKNQTSTWNFDNFVKAIAEINPSLNWLNVILKLDRPNLTFKDTKSFLFLLKFFHRFKPPNTYLFPLPFIFSKWQHLSSQISFVTHLVASGQPDLIFFADLPKRLIPSNPAVLVNGLTPPNLVFWSCIELLELLVELSETDYFIDIRNLFDIPITKCPDTLLMGLSLIKPKHGGALLDELFSHLFPLYLFNHSNSIELLEALWKNNQNLMINAICELYKKENSSLNLSRVLDITQEIKDSLIPIANHHDLEFSVNLGILAGKRDFLHFDQWISERIKLWGNPFINVLLSYIEDNVISPCKNASGPNEYTAILEKSQLTIEHLAIIIEKVSLNTDLKISTKTKSRINEVYKSLCDFYPSLTPGQIEYSDVEEAANIHFHRIYKEELTINEVIDIMTRFKNSPNIRENEIFACMIHNLIDEYKFFNKYPPKELQITGQIFGSIINNKLIDGVTLKISLKCVTEALKKQSGKMFEFGLIALKLFKPRLYEWPHICTILFGIDSLRDRHPDLLDEIRQLLEAKNVPLEIPQEYLSQIASRIVYLQNLKNNVNLNTNNGNSAHASAHLDRSKDERKGGAKIENKIAELINRNTSAKISLSNTESQSSSAPPPTNFVINLGENQLEKEEEALLYRDVNEEVKRKIIFIINTVAPSNVEDKAIELKNLLAGDELNNNLTSNWLCYYLIHKRVINESANHQIYITILTKLNRKNIFKQLLKESYKCINRLLGISKEATPSFDRTILKNIGGWLGMLTLARNKPIILKELDIKNILVDAYRTNRLAYIIPMVCKILEYAKDSIIFTKYNPWLHGLLALLNEMWDRYNLKLSLTCEIQILYNNLGIERSTIPPLNYLEQCIKTVKSSPQMESLSEPINPFIEQLEELDLHGLTDGGYPSNSLKNPGNLGSPQLAILSLPQYVTVDVKRLGALAKDLNLKDIVALAVDLAIREIIPPVINKSVAIALITTKEIALKDFALEADEKKVIRGMYLIAQNLAGSLALVTCREPFRISLSTHIKTILDEQENLEEAAKEQIVTITTNDNLDLGCALIKKAVIEKALEDVHHDSAIMEALEKRRNFKERKEPFFDANTLETFKVLPEILRPNLSGLLKDELKVYEDFRISKGQSSFNQSDTNENNNGSGDSVPFLVKKGKEAGSKIELVIAEMDKIIELEGSISPERANQILSKKFGNNVIPGENEDEILRDTINKWVEQFFLSPQSEKQTYLNLLCVIKTCYPQKTCKFITSAIFNIQEAKRYHAKNLLALFRKNLIIPTEFDANYSAQILSGNSQTSNIQACIIKIIKKLVLDDSELPPSAFNSTIEALKNKANTKENVNFFEELKKIKANESKLKEKNTAVIEDKYLKTCILYINQLFTEVDNNFLQLCLNKFDEWLTITTEDQMTNYIKNLETTALLKNDENIRKFFVYLMEVSVNHAINSDNGLKNSFNEFNNLDYSYIDSFSKLIIILLRTIINSNKAELLERILDSVIIVLIKNHETQQEKFNQRPFFKLFLNLLYDLKRVEYNFTDQEIVSLLMVFVKKFDRIQPGRCPGFAFAWLELISNKYFMPTLLNSEFNKTECHLNMHVLIVDLMKYFKETINNDSISRVSVKNYYKGTLRVLLVLLHDFPEFLSDFYYSLIEDIPEKFIQVRNIILSAFPKNMRPPDPFNIPHIYKIDQIEEFKIIPTISYNFEEKITTSKLHTDINSYYTTKSEADLRSIYKKLTNDSTETNTSLANAFILYVPMTIFKNIEYQKLHEFKTDSMNLLLKLLISGSFEFREVMINSIINQIRYPNLITFYCINFLLLIMGDHKHEMIQEQITRVIVERLIIDRPHPWGVMYAFIELLKNPKYGFKNKNFFKQTDFDKIFKHVFKTLFNGNNNNNNNSSSNSSQNAQTPTTYLYNNAN